MFWNGQKLEAEIAKLTKNNKTDHHCDCSKIKITSFSCLGCKNCSFLVCSNFYQFFFLLICLNNSTPNFGQFNVRLSNFWQSPNFDSPNFDSPILTVQILKVKNLKVKILTVRILTVKILTVKIMIAQNLTVLILTIQILAIDLYQSYRGHFSMKYFFTATLIT